MGTPLTVYYDEGCGPCSRIARVLARLDWRQRLRLRPAAEHPTAQGEQYIDILSDDAGGGRYAGFATYQQIARRVPLLWPVAPLLYLPPVRWAGERVYRKIADGRRCQISFDAEGAER